MFNIKYNYIINSYNNTNIINVYVCVCVLLLWQMSHDPSEIILICWFGHQETFQEHILW